MNPGLRVDPALPHLPQALDAEAMGRTFGELLQPHGAVVEGCDIERIKYRPQRNCSLSYRLRLRDAQGRTLPEQRVAARLCSGDGGPRAMRAARRPLQASAAGPALQWLPALDMLTWWWPNDAKLAAPRVLADEVLLRTRVLPPVVAALGGGRAEGLTARVEIVQYVPESRLTARVHLAWSAQGRRHAQCVYAKASLAPEAAQVHGLLRALQHSATWQAGRLRTPQALLWQPDFGLHWQTELPGTPLLELARAGLGATGPTLAQRLGAQLAELHALPLPQARPPADLPARLAEVVAGLGLALPDQAAALQDLAARLAAGLPALDGLPLATLHGDLHARNVLVDLQDDLRLGLIDLDGLQQGPAMLEFGAVVGEGVYRALLEGAAPTRDAAFWQALQQGYAAAGGARFAGPALAWATAWSLLTERAWRCVVNLKPGRLALVPELLALARRLVQAPSLEALS